jgi:nucleoside-diphosphate-sugar epimerase
MSRVLVTGGAGTIGAAVVRRLLADPAYELRIADARPAPQWMRESCEIHDGDLRIPAHALAALRGCSQVIHLAAFAGKHRDAPSGDPRARPREGRPRPHTIIEFENALHSAVTRAALESRVERFVFVSSSLVYERPEQFPTPEEHLSRCPAPVSARGYSKLAGERYCTAAHEEHGLPYTICRPFGVYGAGVQQATAGTEPAIDCVVGEMIGATLAERATLEIRGSREQTTTLTHVDDVADGLIAALRSPAACNEDFNISTSRELTPGEIARAVSTACGRDPDALSLEYLPASERDAQRSWPSVEKAGELLGWRAQIELEDGLARTVRALRAREATAL